MNATTGYTPPTAGGTTTVKLFDGATDTGIQWTSAGGAAGAAAGLSGESSLLGTGGAGGYVMAPGSPALPAGLTLSAAGRIEGTATVAGMNQVPVIRVTNTVSGLSSDHPLLLSVAQRPAAMPKPVLAEIATGSFRVTLPAAPANIPPISSVDMLFGATLPLSVSTGSVIFNAFPTGTTTFDFTGLAAGSTRHVTLRGKAHWGDGTFLTPNGYSPNHESITLSGANTAPSFTTPPSISPATGPVGTVFALNPGVVSGQPAPLNALVGLTQNGIDVLAQVVSGQFTATEAGPLIATWQATNGVVPNAQAQATASVTAAAQVPAQMAAPTAVVQSQSQIDVTLAGAPADGGSSITSYEIRYSLDQVNWTTVTGLAQGSTTSFLGLLASTRYYFENAARNAMGLGAWSPFTERTTAAPVTGDIQFGQFTAVNAGGIAVAEPDGVYGQFTVQGGILKPNVSPLTVGLTAVGSKTINVAANEYTVASLAEFAAAKTHMTSAGGRTIRFRPGTYVAPVDYFLASVAYSSRVIITAEAGAYFLGNFRFSASNCTLQGLDLQCTDVNKTAVLWMSGACTGSIITRNRIHGVHYDPLGDYSVNVLANPRGITNTAPYLNGCRVTENEIFDVSECMVFYIEGAADVVISDNEGYWHYSDFLKLVFRPGSFDCLKLIERNYGHDGIGDPGDANNPHIDAIQFSAYVDNHMQPLRNVIIRQNVFTFSTKSRGWGDQGLVAFQDGAYQCLLKDPIIAANIIQSQNYSMVLVLDGGVIAHNTLVSAPSANRSSSTSVPGVKYNSGNTEPNLTVIPGGASPLLIRNLWEDNIAIPAAVTQVDNLVIGDRGALTSYASLFTGTDLEADTLAEVSTEFGLKAGGPGTVGFGRGALNTGIMTIGAPRDPSSWTYNAVLEQVNPGVTQALSVDPMPFDGYVYDAAQSTTEAQVRISGKGTSGQQVQVRGASAGGNTAWTTTTVDVAGNWVATFAVPVAEWGNWYTSEARLGTNDATKVTGGGNLWACGHVIGILGQSQPEHILSVHSTYSTGYTFPALAAENFAMITQSGAVAGNAIQSRRYTAANAVINQINVAMLAVANTLHRAMPGRKFLIMDLSEAGTSRIALAWDGETAPSYTVRNWSDLLAMTNMVRAAGSDVGVIIECWQGDDIETAKTFTTEWSPFYFGARWGGGTVTLGTPNPDSVFNSTRPIDHCLFGPQGLFDNARTKFIFAEYPPFNDANTVTDQINFSSTGSRTGQLDRPARDQLRLIAADPRMPCPPSLQGWPMHLADFSAGIHPARNGAIWGIPQYGLQFVAPILAWAGYAGLTVPRIIGTETAADGSYTDVIVDLPANATLTTTRIQRGLAAPATPSPHYQAGGCMGFEIRRAADTDAQRQAIWTLSQTGKPAAYRGTVAFQDTGTGVWPNRRGRIRVTPEVPFVNGDRLEYGRGQSMAVLLEPRDTDAQTWLDLPMAHIPALYDAAAPHRYHGVAVQPQPPVLVLSTASGAAAPAAFTAAQWALDDKGTGGELLVTIDALPSDGGAAINDLQYRIGSGAWVSFGAGTIGAYTISGLAIGVSVSVTIRAVNSVGASAASDTKSKAPTGDVTAPILTSPTDIVNGASAAIGTVSTSEANGTLYAVATTSATTPSAAQIKTGKDHTGAAAAGVATPQVVTAVGAQTINIGGLAPATNYWLHFLHEDAAGNPSATVSGDGFTTGTAPAGLSLAQSAVVLAEMNNLGKTTWAGTPFVVGAGVNRALHFTFHGVDTAATSATTSPTLTATFGGQPITIFGYRYSSTDRAWIAEGYLANPASGSGTLNITTSANQYSMGAVVGEWNGAHQANIPAVLSGNTGSTASPLTTSGTTTVSGSALVAGVSMTRRTAFPSADISVTTGTLLSAGHGGGATDLKTGYFAAGYKAKPTAGADSIVFSWPESGPRWVWQTVELFAAP